MLACLRDVVYSEEILGLHGPYINTTSVKIQVDFEVSGSITITSVPWHIYIYMY